MRRYLIYLFKFLLFAGAVFLFFFVDWDFKEKYVQNAYQSGLALVMFLLMTSLILNAAEEIYLARKKRFGSNRDSVFIGMRNIFVVMSFFAVFVAVFGFFGVDFVTLFASLSIVAAAIAITTKEYINDVLAGFYLGFSRDFEIGDYVKIEAQRGKIIDIGLMRLKLLNDDDDMVFLTNSKVYSSEITNYTRRDVRLMSIDFQIDLQKIAGVEELEKELIESVSEFAEYIHPESYNLKINVVGKDYLDLKFQYRLRGLDQELQRNIRRKTVRKVLSFVTSQRPH